MDTIRNFTLRLLRITVVVTLATGFTVSLTGCPLSVSKTLTVSFDGLEALGDDFVYEGWLIVDGSPVSAGRFSIDEAGMPSPESFMVEESDADGASVYILTIEPAVGDDPAPSSTHILGGDLVSSVATLTVDHASALGEDFATATGLYILNTPSTADDDTDFDQGIWWLDPSAGPGPSLNLPTLPDGWTYEGWVVDMSGPITTGRFLSASGVDSDLGGPTAGSDATPPFPGQDYINPAIVLTGFTAVISIEPEPDNSPNPFTLKPLVDTNVEDVGIGILQVMENNAIATNPMGSVTITE